MGKYEDLRRNTDRTEEAKEGPRPGGEERQAKEEDEVDRGGERPPTLHQTRWIAMATLGKDTETQGDRDRNEEEEGARPG